MTRLTKSDYFAAALDQLSEQGSESLTTAAMVARLGVTKGSFYHHFDGLDDFVGQLLAYWEADAEAALTVRSRVDRDPRRRLAQTVSHAVELPHAVEAAVRAWGRDRCDVAAAVERVDQRRERTLTTAVSAFGVDRAHARSLARVILHVMIGTQQRESPVDLPQLERALAECTRLVALELDVRSAHRIRPIVSA